MKSTIALSGMMLLSVASAAHAQTGQCWIEAGSDSDGLICSVGDAGQLGIGAITVQYAGTLDTGLPYSGHATITASQSNVTVTSIPKSAYP